MRIRQVIMHLLSDRSVISAIDQDGALDNMPLFTSRALRSIEMLRLVTEVEREIGRPIDDDDLVLKNFDTLSAIEALIARYRQRTAQSTLAARQ